MGIHRQLLLQGVPLVASYRGDFLTVQGELDCQVMQGRRESISVAGSVGPVSLMVELELD